MMKKEAAAFSLAVHTVFAAVVTADRDEWVSIIGDPGMRGVSLIDPHPQTSVLGIFVMVCIFAFIFATPLGAKAPSDFPVSPSPRMASCIASDGSQRVSAAANALGLGEPIPGYGTISDVNEYARAKEMYLGSLCSKSTSQGNWTGWSVMFKSGNMNSDLNICPCVVHNCGPKHDGAGYMNQPLVVHQQNDTFGFFAGTYDVDPSWSGNHSEAVKKAIQQYTEEWMRYRKSEISGVKPLPAKPTAPMLLLDASYMFAMWYRQESKIIYYNALKTSKRYPWLMNYLRSNDVSGGYGGYPWNGAGIMFGPAPHTARMNVTLRIIDAAASHDQFYLPEISGCWKLDGRPCDGDILTDVTRYLCFIINPSVKPRCSATSQGACPPWHIRSSDGKKVYRNDTKNFPYSCYYMYCKSPNDYFNEENGACDPYSNPNPQELMQMLPCEEWRIHNFPTALGQGWVNDTREWLLDVGGLGSRVYLGGMEPIAVGVGAQIPSKLSNRYEFPGATRSWISFEIGPEQMDPGGTMVRWEVDGWDVQVPANNAS